MKSLLQTLGLLVALGIVVGGITFFLHYLISPESGKKGNGLPGPESLGIATQLTFPIKAIERQPGVDGEYEVQAPGHQNFWFYNDKKSSINIWLHNLSCACSDVKVCVLSPEESRLYLAWTVATHLLSGFPAALPAAVEDERMLERFCAKAQWQSLEKNAAPVRVPPNTVGLARLIWKGEKEGPLRLSADLYQGESEGPRAELKLELGGLVFVPPFRMYVPPVPHFDLNLRGVGETTIICWSSTRPQFKLERKLPPKEDVQDKCFEVALNPLTEADRVKYGQEKTRLLSGYLITVKVHERREGAQLDLGPVRRKLEFEFVSDDLREPLTVDVAGYVRGEISLAGSPDRDRLLLGDFKASEGKDATFHLESNQPGVELLPEWAVEPPSLKSYVKVKLVKNSSSNRDRAQWDLNVHVPPGLASGKFPPGSAIVLKIQGDPPRRVRLPLHGRAFN